MATRTKKIDWKKRMRRYVALTKKAKQLLIEAVPYLEGREHTFRVTDARIKDLSVELVFDSYSQAERFCLEATRLGHEAKMLTNIVFRHGWFKRAKSSKVVRFNKARRAVKLHNDLR